MAYTLKITLEGSSDPIIWRKVKASESITFFDLHFVIQASFGWGNSHLFMFSPAGLGSQPTLEYDYIEGMAEEPMVSPDNWPGEGRYNADQILLNQNFKDRENCIYLYDFGDSWTHIIELTERNDKSVLHPLCLEGEGKTPTEDIGGIWGYYDMVDVLSDPEDSEREEYMEWLGIEEGKKWNVHEFDLKRINENIRNVWTMIQEEKKNL